MLERLLQGVEGRQEVRQVIRDGVAPCRMTGQNKKGQPMARKQEAVKAADRLMAWIETHGHELKKENVTDHLFAVSVLRQVAGQSADVRRQFCRRCKNEKCGPCIYRWLQGLIGERPPKYKGEIRN